MTEIVESNAATETTKPKRAAPEITTVQMSDGRYVEFVGAKRKMVKDVEIHADGAVTARLDFRNGVTRSFSMPEALRAKFLAFGVGQKFAIEVAGLESAEKCVEAVDKMLARFADGEFSLRGEADPTAGSSILFLALAEVFPNKTHDQIKAFLATKTPAEKVKLRNDGKVKPVYERIQAEKAAGKKEDPAESAALLAGLED